VPQNRHDRVSLGRLTIFTNPARQSVSKPGRQRFRVETGMAGPWALHLSAKIPGTTHVERLYSSSVKWTQVRTVHGEGEVVTGDVTFAAQ